MQSSFLLRVASALVLGAPALLAGGDPPVTSGGLRWGAEYFPNVPLVTQDGETVHFFEDLIRDKVVMINFIYTTCPDACPLETAKLGEVYSILGDRVGKDVFLYSVTIDPEHDTPEVLKEYTQRFQVGPGWTFLTGEAADIKLLRQKLGMIRANEEELSDHTLSLMIGNQSTGIWMKRSPMENPYLLATQVGSWLHNWKQPPEPGRDYADAPKLRNLSRGEDLFRTRCLTCHLVGPEDGLLRQGPNLLGVTDRRDRAWLARWLAEPDAMLAEKDPLALELLAANRNLPMPNMRLNQIEVEALLVYLEQESHRVLNEQRLAELDWAQPDSDGEAHASSVPSCCEKREGLILEDLEDDEAAEGPAAAAAPEPRWPSSHPEARSARGAGSAEGRTSIGVPLAFAASAALCLVLGLAIGILGLSPARRS